MGWPRETKLSLFTCMYSLGDVLFSTEANASRVTILSEQRASTSRHCDGRTACTVGPAFLRRRMCKYPLAAKHDHVEHLGKIAARCIILKKGTEKEA